MSRTILMVVVAMALCAVAVLSGCPKPQQDELQGAPSVALPPIPAATHTMPNGQPMTDSQMKGMGATQATTTAAGDKVETATCPVLGTTMAKKDMIPYEYKGKTYYMCCADCLPKFKANAEKYINNPAKPLPMGAAMPTD